jgi:hypothetical protein
MGHSILADSKDGQDFRHHRNMMVNAQEWKKLAHRRTVFRSRRSVEANKQMLSYGYCRAVGVLNLF